QFITAQLDMLEQMSPWEYQTIRRVLGHGSGFDSPGFREVRRVTPPLGEAFDTAARDAGLDLVDLYVQGREHEELYQLAEALLEELERSTMARLPRRQRRRERIDLARSRTRQSRGAGSRSWRRTTRPLAIAHRCRPRRSRGVAGRSVRRRAARR